MAAKVILIETHVNGQQNFVDKGRTLKDYHSFGETAVG